MSLQLTLPIRALKSISLPLPQQDPRHLTAVSQLLAVVDSTDGPVRIRIYGNLDGATQHVRILTDLISLVRRRRGGDGLVAVMPDGESIELHIASLVASR